MTPEQIQELKAKHPDADLHLLSHDGIEMVFRRPTKDAYRAFKKKTLKEETKLDAAEVLVYACLVSPDASAAGPIFARQFGLMDTFCSKLIDLAGAAKDCEAVPL